MKNVNPYFFRKASFLIATVLLAFMISCEDETNDIIDPGEGDGVNQELIAELGQFAGTSETVYKLSSALLSNTQVRDLDITSLFNVKDDEFIFSSEGNGDLSLAWHEGFGFNASGADDATVMSDTRASSKFESLSFNDESLLFTASGYSFNHSDGLIMGTITL